MTIDTDTDTAVIRKINATIKRISRLLRDLGPPEIQSLALAHLVGTWIGGSFILRDEAERVIDSDATDKVRRELFAAWCDEVRDRIQVHSDQLTKEHGIKRDRN
jgi:hypothetical protein